MAKRLQLRRGSTEEHDNFTGSVGEVTVDVSKHTIVVHDGNTAGGFPVASQNGNNTQTFKVADATNVNDAVSKGQMDTAISTAHRLYNDITLGDYVLEDNRNEALVNPVTFDSITVGTNSTLKLI